MARQHQTVMGHDLPGPRVTAAGLRLAALWLLPSAAVIVVVADLMGWAVIYALNGTCFGLICLIG